MFWRKVWRIIANYVIPLGFAIAIFAYFVMTYPDISDEAKPPLVVALIASLLAAISVSIASRSLELTRNTQRPFLNVIEPVIYGTYEHAIYYIKFFVCNKGIFPADAVSVRCDVFKDGDNVKGLSLELENKAR